ncbi:MAG TPA: hypothetical protein PKD78_08475, partial [Saprospiraceae bacterium]|nr:hypothetical protein [Saprospiraceae bacterium]
MRLRSCTVPLLLLFYFPLSFLTAQSLPLDAAFGTQGLATLDHGSDSPGRATMAAIAADGKVLVGG